MSKCYSMSTTNIVLFCVMGVDNRIDLYKESGPMANMFRVRADADVL